MRHLPKTIQTLLLLASFTLGLSACDADEESKTGAASAALYRLENGNSLIDRYYYALQENSIPVNSAITIHSLQVPIRSIILKGNGGEAQIYTCSGQSGDECLVELTGEALDNLLSEATTDIPVGSYSEIQVSTCYAEGGYEALIKAEGSLQPDASGPTYYTKTSESALSQTAPAEPTRVYFSGCARTYPLTELVDLAEDQTIEVKLYFDIEQIAFFGDGRDSRARQAAYAGGASFPYDPNTPPEQPFVAVNYLDVAATIDEGEPYSERYLITANYGSTAQGIVGLFYNSNGSYFGGYTRSYYDSNSTTGSNWFVTPIKTFTQNDDDSYNLSNFGSSRDGNGYFNTSSFRKQEATNLEFIDQDGNRHTYAITPL